MPQIFGMLRNKGVRGRTRTLRAPEAGSELSPLPGEDFTSSAIPRGKKKNKTTYKKKISADRTGEGLLLFSTFPMDRKDPAEMLGDEGRGPRCAASQLGGGTARTAAINPERATARPFHE